MSRYLLVFPLRTPLQAAICFGRMLHGIPRVYAIALGTQVVIYVGFQGFFVGRFIYQQTICCRCIAWYWWPGMAAGVSVALIILYGR